MIIVRGGGLQSRDVLFVDHLKLEQKQIQIKLDNLFRVNTRDRYCFQRSLNIHEKHLKFAQQTLLYS